MADPLPELNVHGNGHGAVSSREQVAGRAHFSRADQDPSDVMVALSYGLELVQHGAMLVAEEGHPQLANQIAQAILKQKDGIALASTGLVTERASDTRLLHKLVQDAIQSPELGEPRESPITLQRRAASKSLIVRVMPGPGLGRRIGGEKRTALLKLYDQDRAIVVDEGALIRLYGLTRGEASFAARLVRGKSIEEAANELFISIHTARTHVKRIFMKTDTHRQSELLVRLLLPML
jgi:DNA-binding CsgD family transcriptional regulator